MKKSSNKPRNAYLPAAKARKSGKMRPKAEKRKNGKNKQLSFLNGDYE